MLQDDDDSDDDELQGHIMHEHAKFLEGQKARQEALRAARPWSAPPLMSPRPESQRTRQAENVELASDSSKH
jgi:hypothetical protein